MSRPSPLLRRSIGALALSFFVACSGGEREDSAERDLERVELPLVRVEPIARREMVQRMVTTTVVRSQRQVEVLPQANGVVLEILAEEGDAVAAGAVLARLDAREPQAALREARVALREAENGVAASRIALREAEAAVQSANLAAEQARRTFERNENTGLISMQELDALRLGRETAERDSIAAGLMVERRAHDLLAAETSRERSAVLLERAELALSHTDVRAPFAGRIAERRVSAGDSVGAQSALFVLVDPDDLVAVLHRPQRELGLFLGTGPRNGGEGGPDARDMEITAQAEALPGRVFQGELLRLSPSIDPESGSFRVTVRLLPDEHGVQLLPGMLVRLGVVTERRPDALVVPKRAVQREGDALVLWRYVEGRVSRVRVEEGLASDDELEVLPAQGSQLEAGELVVVVGNRDLEEGDEVELAAAEEAPEEDSEHALPPGAEEDEPQSDDAQPSADPAPPVEADAETDAQGPQPAEGAPADDGQDP